MVVNYGQVPRRVTEPDRGFKLLLLDERGRTQWFGRCAWASLPAMRREVDVLLQLREDPFAARHIPETRVTNRPPLFLQVSRYLGDVSYGRTYDTLAPAEWGNDVREIEALSQRLMQTATERVPILSESPGITQREWVLEGDLRTLRDSGFDRALVRMLERAVMPAANATAELQHGDLWPANVLRAEGRWWLIDFAECGVVWTPLYDLFHLISTPPARATRRWYGEQLDRSDAWTVARFGALKDAAIPRGLDVTTVGSCLVYYLLHLTAYRMRPGVPADISTENRVELERMAQWLLRHDGNPTDLLAAAFEG